MDYSKMSDFEINRLVAISEGVRGFHCENVGGGSALKFSNWKELDYCNNPADGWPIIMKSGINVFTDMIPHGLLGQARASITRADAVSDCIIVSDKNPLRAAMIVFLMMQESANVQTDSTR